MRALDEQPVRRRSISWYGKPGAQRASPTKGEPSQEEWGHDRRVIRWDRGGGDAEGSGLLFERWWGIMSPEGGGVRDMCWEGCR